MGSHFWWEFVANAYASLPDGFEIRVALTNAYEIVPFPNRAAPGDKVIYQGGVTKIRITVLRLDASIHGVVMANIVYAEPTSVRS